MFKISSVYVIEAYSAGQLNQYWGGTGRLTYICVHQMNLHFELFSEFYASSKPTSRNFQHTWPMSMAGLTLCPASYTMSVRTALNSPVSRSSCTASSVNVCQCFLQLRHFYSPTGDHVACGGTGRIQIALFSLVKNCYPQPKRASRLNESAPRPRSRPRQS